MARVAFPSYDVQTVNGFGGGVGTFIRHFARRLREAGDDVTIIFATGADSPLRVDQRWRDIYQAWGIEVIEVHNPPPPTQRWPDIWTVRLSEHIAPVIRDFDVVYFGDWANLAFHTVRQKRFTTAPMPTCVTVLHGASTWVRQGDRETPRLPDHLHMEYQERYSAEHSDFVASPSRRMVEYTTTEGWRFRRQPEVIGLPFWPDDDADQRRALPDTTPKIRRIVFFGRLQQRKGYDTFAKALVRLGKKWPDTLVGIDEIVLLGQEHDQGSVTRISDELRPLGVPVRHIGNLDSNQANAYLRGHARDALVVVPSPHENFPYAVIEASLIPGLNLICTRGGGTPEVFTGGGSAQLFHPSADALAERLRERLREPLAADQLARYDFAAANAKWLSFHDRVRDHALRKNSYTVPLSEQSVVPTVDICITFFNKGRHFAQLCQSLQHQSWQNFRVIAVDDGSTDPESIAMFDAMAAEYRERGWIFFRQPNLFVDAARNAAARHSDADYLLMLDGDDILAVSAIERMLQAALMSGDDCLVAGIYFFSGNELPYDPVTGAMTITPPQCSMPLGTSLVSGLIDPSVFGGPVVLVRRRVFEAIGGYREVRGAAHEDWELHARLAFEGYKTDVFPEYLHFYRQLEDSLWRQSDHFVAKQRMIDTYEHYLGRVGLYGAANATWAAHSEAKALRSRIWELEWRVQDTERRLHESEQRLSARERLPAAVEADACLESSRPGKTAVLRQAAADPDERTRILILIPTLGIGGAEMDVARNVPRLDRSLFDITVCTFQERGELAQDLVDKGIDVVGPTLPTPPLGFLRRLLQAPRLAAAQMKRRAKAVVWRAVMRLGVTMPASWRRPFVAFARPLRSWLRTAAVRTRGWRKHWYYALSIIPLPPLGHLVSSARTYFRAAHPIRHYIEMRDFQIVHAILPNAYFLAAVAILPQRRRRLVMSRLSLNWYQKNDRLLGMVERGALHRRVDVAIGNSSVILKELAAEGLPDARLRLLYNGIDVTEFRARLTDCGQARLRLDVAPAAIVFSCVANLYPYKGHADLLHALRKIAHRMPAGWVLLAVGRDVGGSLGELRRLSAELQLSRNVRFLGQRADVPIILSAADIHVSASHHEGLPNNILEAMCAGLPVVATNAGGVPELVVDGSTGVLVPPRNPDRLAEALMSLVEDRALRHAMGAAGHERARACFSIERSVRAYEEIYAEVAKGA